jgi:hypothetical protein
MVLLKSGIAALMTKEIGAEFSIETTLEVGCSLVSSL